MEPTAVAVSPSLTHVTAKPRTALWQQSKPCAEGIEPLQFGKVDIDVARLAVAASHIVNDLLKFGGTFSGPCAGRCEIEALSFDGSGKGHSSALRGS